MLKEIKENIKNIRKVRYQKTIYLKKNINLRKKAIKYILENTKNISVKEKHCNSCIFFSKYLNKKNFISFYKKFNSRLQLKEKYNLVSLKKESNKNACFKSYILFSETLMENKKINNIQKLNTIFKINDLLILMYSKNKHSKFVKFFLKNIQYENKLLKKYL